MMKRGCKEEEKFPRTRIYAHIKKSLENRRKNIERENKKGRNVS